MTAVPFPGALPASPAGPADDDAGREIRVGAWLGAGFAAALVAAGTLIPLDAAVVAPGIVKVLGERQKLQAGTDGTVQVLAVREGQRVRAGDVLIRLAPVEQRSAERALASRVTALQAEIARLEAEEVDAATIATPAAFATYAGEDRALAERALAMEQRQLDVIRSVFRSQRGILGQRIVQIREQSRGTAERQGALEAQRALLGQELDGIGRLAAQGYASRNRLLEMQRSDKDLAGSIGSMEAEGARLRASAGEARMQLEQDRVARLREDAQRLAQARTELASLEPQWSAARAALDRTVLRAPVGGAVVGLTQHTVGGYVPRGDTLLEIVPADRGLEIEAQVDTADGNTVRAGQVARLRLPALHGRNVPQIAGTVTAVSADSLADERTGRSYYRMTVRVAGDEIARLAGAGGTAVPLRPGNPVSVSVAVRSRSALGYWLEPLAQSLRGSLHEL